MRRIWDKITPFTLITRSDVYELQNIIMQDKVLSKLTYSSINISFRKILQECENNQMLFYDGNAGYNSNLILQGVQYLICANKGELNGTRPKGSQEDCFKKMIKEDPDHNFTFKLPNRYSVLLITDGEYSAMIGCIDPLLNKKLLIRDESNKYLIKLKKPDYEDLSYAKKI